MASLPPHTLNTSSSPCTPTVGSLGLNLAQSQYSQCWFRLGDTRHASAMPHLPHLENGRKPRFYFLEKAVDWVSTQELPCTPDRDEAGNVQVLNFVCSASFETMGLAGYQLNYPDLYLGNLTMSNLSTHSNCFLISHAHQRKNHIANKHKQNHHSMRLY